MLAPVTRRRIVESLSGKCEDETVEYIASFGQSDIGQTVCASSRSARNSSARQLRVAD